MTGSRLLAAICLGVLATVVLGLLGQLQHWQQPLALVVAVAAGLGVMLLSAAVLDRVDRR